MPKANVSKYFAYLYEKVTRLCIITVSFNLYWTASCAWLENAWFKVLDWRKCIKMWTTNMLYTDYTFKTCWIFSITFRFCGCFRFVKRQSDHRKRVTIVSQSQFEEKLTNSGRKQRVTDKNTLLYKLYYIRTCLIS